MATLRLKYNFTTLPALTDRDGEVVGNWVGNGNHSISADSTYSHGGSKSLKVIASDRGDFTTNYISLASDKNASFTATKNYAITLWAKNADGVNDYDIQVKTGGVTCAAQSVPAGGAWTPLTFKFAAVTAATALQIALVDAATIWIDDITVSEYIEVSVLREKGMTDPEWVEMFPSVMKDYVDGSKDTKFRAFRRKMQFYLGVVSSRDNRLGILYWYLDNDRQIDYGNEVQIAVVPDESEYESDWLNDFSATKAFTLNVCESVVRTTFPV